MHLQQYWKTLENQSANLQTYLASKQFRHSIFLCSEECFQVWTVISLFTVNAPYRCAQLSCTRKNWANREVQKKLVRNPPIRNAHIYPCNSSGYQNELLCTNLPMDYTNGLGEAWDSCVTTNVMLMRKIECSNLCALDLAHVECEVWKRLCGCERRHPVSPVVAHLDL